MSLVSEGLVERAANAGDLPAIGVSADEDEDGAARVDRRLGHRGTAGVVHRGAPERRVLGAAH